METIKTNLANNCTREEALKHFGFTLVGRKSIRGNRYSKCWYHEKLQIFAVPFAWRTIYHKFMSRDEAMQKLINKYTSEMWYSIDVIENFERLSEKLDAIEA